METYRCSTCPMRAKHDARPTMDVTREDSVDALDTLIEQIGSPDLFFYVSGVGYQNPELNLDKEIRTVRTNCEGMVRMVDHFINYVRSHRQDYT